MQYNFSGLFALQALPDAGSALPDGSSKREGDDGRQRGVERVRKVEKEIKTV